MNQLMLGISREPAGWRVRVAFLDSATGAAQVTLFNDKDDVRAVILAALKLAEKNFNAHSDIRL